MPSSRLRIAVHVSSTYRFTRQSVSTHHSTSLKDKKKQSKTDGMSNTSSTELKQGAQVSNLTLAPAVRPILLSLKPSDSDHTHMYTLVNKSFVPIVRQLLLTHHLSSHICVPTLVKSPSLVPTVRQSSLGLHISRGICVPILVKSHSFVPTVRQSSLGLTVLGDMCVRTLVKSPSLVPTVRQSSLSLHISRGICVPTLVKKPFSCTYCEAKFSQSAHLKRHLPTHTCEKPFSCTYCKAKFSRSSNLKTHLRTHTGEKPFFCTCCEAKFSRSAHLKRHLRIFVACEVLLVMPGLGPVETHVSNPP